VSIIRLSEATYRKSLQNLWWAAGYNIVAIPLAAGAFAWAGISMPPAVAAVLMSVSTIVVALNAQLLRRVDLRPATIPTPPQRQEVEPARPASRSNQ
jgi:P-type Cu2+ transporter